MNEQLNIKVISRVNADKAIFTLEKGNAYSTKATPNTKYQLIDTATKLGPASVKVVRVGKDLRIRVYSAEELSYELILEGYSDAEGVAVIGELPDGGCGGVCEGWILVMPCITCMVRSMTFPDSGKRCDQAHADTSLRSTAHSIFGSCFAT